MTYLVKLKIDLIAPDNVLREAGCTYHSMEKDVVMKLLPYPGLQLRFRRNGGVSGGERYRELCKLVENKTGIFEVDRCIVDFESETDYDIVVELRNKGERTLEAFTAIPEFLGFYGFTTFGRT